MPEYHLRWCRTSCKAWMETANPAPHDKDISQNILINFHGYKIHVAYSLHRVECARQRASFWTRLIWLPMNILDTNFRFNEFIELNQYVRPLSLSTTTTSLSALMLEELGGSITQLHLIPLFSAPFPSRGWFKITSHFRLDNPEILSNATIRKSHSASQSRSMTASPRQCWSYQQPPAPSSRLQGQLVARVVVVFQHALDLVHAFLSLIASVTHVRSHIWLYTEALPDM